MKVLTETIAALTACALFPLTVQGQAVETPSGPSYTPAPLPAIRAEARTIRVRDIAFLRFAGIWLGVDRIQNREPIVVRDPKLIARFIQALRVASGKPAPSGSRNCTMEVCPPPSKRRIVRRPPYHLPGRTNHRFKFDPGSVLDGFGEPFQDALRELERYHIGQIRKRVVAAVPRVQAIRFKYRASPVTDSEEVARLLAALQQLDERAFAPTKRGQHERIVLILRGGRQVNVNLLPEPFPLFRDTPEAPVPDNNGPKNPPLPPVLWKYCAH